MSTHFMLLELYVNANCTTTCSRSKATEVRRMRRGTGKESADSRVRRLRYYKNTHERRAKFE